MKSRRNNTIKGTLALLLLLAVISVQAQTNVVPDDVEFQALKALYDNTGGANWTTKTNWPVAGSWPATATAAQMGTWYGVTVTNGDITTVSLNTNNLVGTLPAALSQLTQLTKLQLTGNTGLTGVIPASLGSLSKLQYIYLFSNQLSGTIPAELGNLTNLIYLSLYGNQLSGSIPSTLGNLNKLTNLILNNNQLSGSLPAELGNMSALAALSLQGNQISGPIPPSLGQLTNLTSLQMHSNQLTGAIPSSIGNLTKLSVLYLYSNQLSGSIPTEIGNLVNLTDVRLHINQLSGAIPSSIGNLTKVNTFLLISNRLTGSIPHEIGGMTNLNNLQLNNNLLTGSIPNEIGNLTKLSTQLQLSNNQLTGSIPNSIGNLVNLIFCDLHGNQLSGSIPPELGNLTKLTNLQLYSNQLSGSIPSSLGNLINLQILYLHANQLSGSIPPSFGNLTNLTQLYLNNNQFGGDVPSISGCTKLAIFMAQSNQFTSLPASMLNLNLLNSVNFSSNALISIPNFANHANKANLTLTINGNYLDYSQLEPLIGAGIKSLVYSNQNNINDVTSVNLTLGSDLVLTARPKGAATSNITWQKLAADGVNWNDITSANADAATGTTYRVASATTAAEGKYRWYCTSTVATAFTLTSTAIEVKTPIRFTLDNLAFQYKYDGRNRMVAKRVPGADWVYMVYDQRDRLVMTQDGNLRAANQWLFTKYDALNRPVMTGIYTHTGYATQEQMSSQISTASFTETFSPTSNHGYTTNIFPNTNLDIRTVTYYDNYNYLSMWGSDNAYAYVPNQVDPVMVNGVTYSQPAAANMQVIGKVTGTKVRTSPNDPYWLQTATYYDDKYRVIQTLADNFKDGTDITTNLYDFPGKVLASKTKHTVNGLTWQNMTAVAMDGNILKKTGGAGGWNAGASSVQQIPAGVDGWVESTVLNVNPTSPRIFGLSDQDTDTNINSVDYGFYETGAQLQAYIKGTPVATLTMAIGDKLRIARENGNMVFYRNGIKIYPTGGTTLPCSTALLVDASFYNQGNAISHVRLSVAPGPQRTIARKLEYDHAQRPTKVWHSVNGSTPVLLLQNEYNEIGQLVDKKLHSTDGTSFKQSIDYRYNIRGWLNSVNNSQLIANSDNDDSNSDRDLFGMELAYEKTITGINNDPLYNGNIGAIKWSNNLALGTTKDVAYKYGYDTLNRLKSAVYLTNPGAWTSSTNFAESGFKYDLNGNILALQRTDANGTTMDQLKYTYDPVRGGNQLKAVSDDGSTSGFKDGNKTGDDYTYDLNGNMKVDKNKSITAITYNEQNLPLVVTKSTGENIKYIYDATGRKVSQLVYNASGTLTKKTDYVGEFIYQNDTLQFINHEEGRVVMNQPALQSGGTTEYQYHLKDHLGNVRMTFTTQPVTEQPVATFETVNAVTEQGKFLRMDDARLVNSRLFDHTYTGQTPPGDGSAYSERLSGSANEKTGVARSISVMPGDIIRMEVFVKYVDPTNSNNTTSLTQLLGQIANNSAGAGVVIDGANYLTNGSTLFPYTGLAGEGSSSGTGPKAYLNYIMFDRNYVPVLNDLSQTNFVRVSTDAKEDGTTNLPYGKAHEKLYAEVVVKQPGYMYIYLSNEETTPVDVFFDDFKVTQVKSPVVQMEDFYPFGLSFNQYQRENSLQNKYLFNGKELQSDLSLNWLDYGARMYMGDIGRWGVIDPMGEKGRRWSPYNYAFDNPMRFIDPDGMWPDIPSWSDVGNFANGVVNAIASNSTTVTSVDGRTNLVQGIARGEGGSAYTAGQKAGDLISMVQGVGEMALGVIVGTGGTVGGVITSPTVVGAAAGAAVVGAGAAIATHGANTLKNGLNNMLNAQGSGQGRGKNKRKPDPDATGDHSTIDQNGATTFEKNDKNPTGWQEVEHIDTKGSPHVNKQTGQSIPVPHRQGKKIPGGVEPVDPNKAPKYKGKDEPGFKSN
jgi:RHS repeat-associated protein